MTTITAIRAAPTIGHRVKRWLYIVHRWVGIASCLLFAIWFVSGLVMIYVPFPSLSREERLAGLPAIDWNLVRVPFGPALRAAGVQAPPRAFVLEMRGNQPVWRIAPADGDEITLSATDGSRLSPAGRAEAERIAEAFGRAPVSALTRIERDQWTVAGGFTRHRPLWKAELAGPGGRTLYVSSTNGAVVLETDANERFWNWLGSVPHWIYLTEIRKDNAVWRQVVMWVSGPCMIAAFTGLWIGLLRTRIGKRRFKGGRMIPYRGWMEWHHVAGLIGGVMLTTWIFSGWLSVDPFRLFESGGIGEAEEAAYVGARIPPAIDPQALGAAATGARQVELSWAVGRPYLLVRGAGPERVLDAATLRPAKADQPAMLAAASRLIPGARLIATERLTEPDLYYYEVAARPALPVLRLKYDDPAATWIYLEPTTGAILGGDDSRRRLYRILYDLLHKWDWNLLTLNRPAWDLFLWLFSLAGLVTSISAIRIGWSRLRHGQPARRGRRTPPPLLEKDYA